MDVVLLTLTTLSLAAAAGFGALSWRVGLEERERSRARIAALSTAMDGGHSSDAGRTRIAVGSVVDRVRAEGGDAALGGRPLIKFAAIGVMTIAIVVGSLVGYRTHGSAATAISSAPAPLELMSMRYQHEGTNLTVSGLVRNPSGGSSVNGVTAVVFAFDRNGGFVASGRAPLDFGALAPGDESPFVVTVPNVSDVARYRVSFRTGAGVVRHVDRRNAPVLAQAVR
jgi:hypothetical protein